LPRPDARNHINTSWSRLKYLRKGSSGGDHVGKGLPRLEAAYSGGVRGVGVAVE